MNDNDLSTVVESLEGSDGTFNVYRLARVIQRIHNRLSALEARPSAEAAPETEPAPSMTWCGHHAVYHRDGKCDAPAPSPASTPSDGEVEALALELREAWLTNGDTNMERWQATARVALSREAELRTRAECAENHAKLLHDELRESLADNQTARRELAEAREREERFRRTLWAMIDCKDGCRKGCKSYAGDMLAAIPAAPEVA